METSIVTPYSADSHTIEPPIVYSDYVAAQYRDRAPRLGHDEVRGVVYHVEGLAAPIPVGGLCMCDVPPAERGDRRLRPFEELPKGGYDARARLQAQDYDGVSGEVIYPTVGMVICQHRDPDFRYEMLWGYNRWLKDFTSENPARMTGIAQLALRSVEDGIAELKAIHQMGFRGAMLPGDPLTEQDYDDPAYDPFWRTAVELGLPLSFHSLTSARAKGSNLQTSGAPRGSSAIANLTNIVRSNQDIIAMLIWGGVFERFPDLRMVCVEADASWAPHMMQKMDQYYDDLRGLMRVGEFKRRPSEMFRDNLYMTFQFDWLAFKMTDYLNPDRLMWANDFPHTDATWPRSQALLQANLVNVPAARATRILRDNVKELYHIA